MKVKKFYTLRIECNTQKEYDDVVIFVNMELNPEECLCFFEDEDLLIQLEYIEGETLEKISNFLKTL